MTDYTKSQYAKTEKIKNPKITVFPARGNQPIIHWDFPEFQCLCPVSKRIDHGVVKIKYKPKHKIIESKSVRDYLTQWRNKKIWQEYVTEEIANTLFKASESEWLIVEIEWSPRGGIFATTISKKGQKKEV